MLAVKPDWNVSVAAVPLKRGELRLELLVEGHRPGDRPDRAGSGPEPLDRRQGGGAQPRMVGEPEVVVRGQADEPAVVDRHDRALGRAHDPERPVEVPRRGGRRAPRRGRRAGRVVPSRHRMRPMLSPSPVHEHLARVARAGRRERRLEVAEPEAMGDRRADVEPRLEHHRHLVPGLVHLPAVDPRRVSILNTILFTSIEISAVGMPRIATPPPWAIASIAARSAAALPDISRATS